MEGTKNVLFRHNEETGKWECFSRNDYNNYWNDRSSTIIGTGFSPETALLNWGTKNQVMDIKQ